KPCTGAPFIEMRRASRKPWETEAVRIQADFALADQPFPLGKALDMYRPVPWWVYVAGALVAAAAAVIWGAK
ncbi:MAG TPA: hypothetical protein VFW40_05015, partial [Capsulimonadaceae bacterium]|nr:hypothetical protein [Capsulimonadaceae bacterium]